MNLKIEKENGIPIYHQLIEQIVTLIESGEIIKGDRLPPERELSEKIGISRGTVKKAYDDLTRRRILESVQGKGTFVCFSKQDVKNSYARTVIEQNITQLEKTGLSYGEIKSMYDIIILEKMSTSTQVRIATIDCNPETLEIIRRQVCGMCNCWLVPFVLDDILGYVNPEEVFKNFNLIITTTTHYESLKQRLGKASDKLTKTVVSPNRETIVELAGIKDGSLVGVLCKSQRFLEIICNNLKSLNKDFKTDSFIVEPDTTEEAFKQFLDAHEYIISPPFYTLNLNNSFSNHILNFHSRGKKIVIFNYEIERGSLVYIMENL